MQELLTGVCEAVDPTDTQALEALPVDTVLIHEYVVGEELCHEAYMKSSSGWLHPLQDPEQPNDSQDIVLTGRTLSLVAIRPEQTKAS